jgi:hypothetical protein
VREPDRVRQFFVRPHTVEAYATEAGFDSVEILPIENDFWRFYRLNPQG